MSKDILKEAIANAKAVRETALENAKIALEEAFTPKLQSMISAKIQQEMEGDESEGYEENVVAEIDLDEVIAEIEEDLAAGDDPTNTEDDEEDENLFANDATWSADFEEGVEATNEDEDINLDELYSELKEEGEEDVEVNIDVDGAGEEGDEEIDIDIEDDEIEGEEGPVYPEFEIPETDEEGNPYPEEWKGGYEIGFKACYDAHGQEKEGEEDIDIDIEDDEVAVDGGNAEELEAELAEANKVIALQKKKLNEVNLLNSKLLFANKLFRGLNLTLEQKRKVIDALDKAKTVNEAKLVFTTLTENLKTAKKKKVVSEQRFASRAQASTKPKDTIIENVDPQVARWQKLANINKKK